MFLFSIFEQNLIICTTKLRSSDQFIDFVKLEGILYPGMSDPLLEIRNAKFNYTTLKSDSINELSKNFNDQYDEYCKVFYRILPDKNGQIDNRPEFDNYNQFWTGLFRENSNFNIPAISMIYVNNKSNKNNQKDYFEELGKSIPKDLQKLSLQYSLITKLIQLNITQYGYIRSKYWDKSLELIKKQIFKQSEIEVLESDQSSEQTQQIIISLMQYYAGQFTVSQKTNQNQGKQRQNTKETDVKLLEAIFGAGNKYSFIKQSFNYKEVNLNLEEQNKKYLQIQINQLIIYQDQHQMKQKEENQNHWQICSIIQRL